MQPMHPDKKFALYIFAVTGLSCLAGGIAVIHAPDYVAEQIGICVAALGVVAAFKLSFGPRA